MFAPGTRSPQLAPEHDPEMRERAWKCVEHLLKGAGDVERTKRSIGRWTLHLRRALTDGEIAMIPSAWCELPAVDEADEEEVIER